MSENFTVQLDEAMMFVPMYFLAEISSSDIVREIRIYIREMSEFWLILNVWILKERIEPFALLLLADSDGPDQTVWVCRLIWAFAVRISQRHVFAQRSLFHHFMIFRYENSLGWAIPSWVIVRLHHLHGLLHCGLPATGRTDRGKDTRSCKDKVRRLSSVIGLKYMCQQMTFLCRLCSMADT